MLISAYLYSNVHHLHSAIHAHSHYTRPHFATQVFSLIKAWCSRPKPSLPSVEGDDDDAASPSRPWGEYVQGEEEGLDETQRAQLRAAKKAQAVS